MKITDLGGNSGCKIYLYESDDNSIFVRKISGSIEYNERLRLQAEKQKTFKNDVVKVPKVYETGINDDGMFYFDMEYIQGITLSEHIKTVEVGKVRSLVDSVVSNIVANKNEGIEADPSVFIDKIYSLKQKLSALHNATVDKAIEALEKHSWDNFTRTICHGDLTFENIIVKDGQLYYIDFLDSFYDCWLLDISTLMQDAQTMWSYRYEDEVNINTLIRLIIFRDILMESVKEKIDPLYIEVYYALLLKLIRIYPYAKDEAVYNFLNTKTNSILAIIKKEGAVV